MEDDSPSDVAAPWAAWVCDAYERYARSLLRYCRSIVRDEDLAQDLVHDVFVKLCQQERIAVAGHLEVWLFRVSRNHAIDWLRRHGRMKTQSLDDYEGPVPSPSNGGLEQEERLQRVLLAMGHLPLSQQEVLRLRFQNGLSYKQIAEITERSVDHVGVLIHQGVCRLRERLGTT